MPKQLPTFEVGYTPDNRGNLDRMERVSVQWGDAAGYRFHIWLRKNDDGSWATYAESRSIGRRRMQTERVETIYKNAPKGQESRTRYLDARSPKWAAITEAAVAFANSGVVERVALERVEAEERRIAQENAEANRAHARATRDRLSKFADELKGYEHQTDLVRFAARQLATYLTDDQAIRLSSYIHNLV